MHISCCYHDELNEHHKGGAKHHLNFSGDSDAQIVSEPLIFTSLLPL